MGLVQKNTPRGELRAVMMVVFVGGGGGEKVDEEWKGVRQADGGVSRGERATCSLEDGRQQQQQQQQVSGVESPSKARPWLPLVLASPGPGREVPLTPVTTLWHLSRPPGHFRRNGRIKLIVAMVRSSPPLPPCLSSPRLP